MEEILIKKILENIEKVIMGKHNEIIHLLKGIIAGGHILIEDVPGVGKTTLVKAQNFENISGEEIIIFVDLNKKNNDYDIYGIYEEKVVDIAVSLINFMRKKDIQTKVYINSIVPREFNISCKEDFNSLVEYFVNQESDAELDFCEYIQQNYYKIHKVNKLALITSKIDEKLISNIIRMKNSGYSITLYHSLEEENDIQLAVGINFSATLTDEEGALVLEDEILREHFIKIVTVFYREYYGGIIDTSFNKLEFYKFIEAYVKKNQNLFKYYYNKIK